MCAAPGNWGAKQELVPYVLLKELQRGFLDGVCRTPKENGYCRPTV